MTPIERLLLATFRKLATKERVRLLRQVKARSLGGLKSARDDKGPLG